MSRLILLIFTEFTIREKRGAENGICGHYIMITSDESCIIHLAILTSC
jgi:hypothetical protein